MKVLRGRFDEVKWTAMGMVINPETGKYENQGYVMVVKNSKWDFRTTQGTIEVRGNAKSKDWKVLICGEVMAVLATKSEAQHLASEMAD